jgi:hypothetical protein
MRRAAQQWRELFSGLGEALAELLAAELEALRRDFARSGRGLLGALVYLATALAMAFWLVALLVAFVVALAAVWLPAWAAVLVAFALLSLGTAALLWAGYRRMKRLQGPVEIVEHRWRDHLDWWHERVLEEPVEATIREEQR